jgi:hypothetical protein
MGDVTFFKIFNLLVGTIGIALGIGLILVPNVIAELEKKLDKNFSTEKLEQFLNERKNLSQSLLKKPKFFGIVLLVISFLLLLSSVLWI